MLGGVFNLSKWTMPRLPRVESIRGTGAINGRAALGIRCDILPVMDQSPTDLMQPKDRAIGVYRVGVDTGGTFTDLVLTNPMGFVAATHKLPSTPSDPSVAVLRGIDALLENFAGDTGISLRRGEVEVTHGSTVATNALIELVQRDDDGLVFVTTAGFEDLLFLGRQHRPDLYALVPRRPPPPLSRGRCVGVRERMAFDGSVIEPLSEEEVARCVERAVGLRPSAVALCLLHAYANDAHETQLAGALRAALPSGVAVTVSSELLPVRREFERAAACVVNAAVGPAMRGYLGRLAAEVGQGLAVMGSHGGTMGVREAIGEPVRTMLSGPAGGVAGVMGLVGDVIENEEAAKLITLDMGGTSTDVCLIDGALGGATLSTDHESAGLPVAMPMVDVHAVGAGGGSIAWVDDGGALRVGPRSAGAAPGPAAYGRQRREREARRGDDLATEGWWPTVTDAHVVLGHLDVSQRVGGLTLSLGEAEAAVGALATRLGVGLDRAARGVLAVADASMARAVHRVSLRRGRDPRRYALVAFGGAGGLHACSVAERLGMSRVLVPASPGLMCAAGMLVAPRRRTAERTVDARISTEAGVATQERTEVRLRETFDALVEACGVDESERTLTLEARYVDQTHTLTLNAADFLENGAAHARLLEGFYEQHAERFGWCDRAKDVVWVASRCVADRTAAVGGGRSSRIVYADDAVVRGGVGPGETVRGPFRFAEATGTTLVPAGWSARIGARGTISIERVAQEGARGTSLDPAVDTPEIDALELEAFRQLFAAAAEEMGETLMRCASSPNITERLDHSCAVFDASGAMVAQAAHIPVHLGSSPASVRAVIDAFGLEAMRPGDRFVLNDPFSGGTHLPDVTVVCPVFFEGIDLPAMFVAARAHHADVGGEEPGSMGLSTSIEQEGVRLRPARWTEETVARFAAGSRTPDERRSDLFAQAAAVDAGAKRLIELARSHGVVRLVGAATALLRHARRLTEATLSGLPHGRFDYEDFLDGDGLPPDAEGRLDVAIRCTLTVNSDDPPTFDFTRSDDQVSGPMNATRSIVESAVLYALRLACGAELPSNSGILDAVRVLTRPGSVVDARSPAAVAGGNVETSQRLVDVVLGVLDEALPGRLPADSCGSMNNVVIGSPDRIEGSGPASPFAYYETLAGGAGAGPDASGGDAVHTHMTNTRNTPIEALEARFPLRISRYGLREGAGGGGRHAGGAGVVRHYRFLRPVRITLLLERRRHAPRPRNHGEPGRPGAQRLRRANGTTIDLPAKCVINADPDDTLELETPGGAGWGRVLTEI